jgi:hypothetical protein
MGRHQYHNKVRLVPLFLTGHVAITDGHQVHGAGYYGGGNSDKECDERELHCDRRWCGEEVEVEGLMNGFEGIVMPKGTSSSREYFTSPKTLPVI